jgi:hypothetical protein
MEGTAIPVVDETEGEVAALSPARSLGVLAVIALAVALAVLPALVAIGWAPSALTAAVAAGAGLAVAAGGLKWAAFVWGLASRGSDPGLRPPVPVVD